MSKIGFYDSGVGGLTILSEFYKVLPNKSYIYFADQAYCPLGDKTPQQIFARTIYGLEYLFSQGCDLVVLACNTATAYSIRKIQQKWLPKNYPNKKVLGIIRPVGEYFFNQITQQNPNQQKWTVGLLATNATIKSNFYQEELTSFFKKATKFKQNSGKKSELQKNLKNLNFRFQIQNQTKFQIQNNFLKILKTKNLKTKKSSSNLNTLFIDELPAVGLADSIEQQNYELAEKILQSVLANLKQIPDILILACTHYPLVENIIYKVLQKRQEELEQKPQNISNKKITKIENQESTKKLLQKSNQKSDKIDVKINNKICILSQSNLVAEKLLNYIQKNPRFTPSDGKIKFVTTKDVDYFHRQIQVLFPQLVFQNEFVQYSD